MGCGTMRKTNAKSGTTMAFVCPFNKIIIIIIIASKQQE
jgi:hypothetical protein